MQDHRIRLTDDDLSLIVAALRARAAMAAGKRLHRLERLAERLSDLERGNPTWRLSPETQRREELAD